MIPIGSGVRIWIATGHTDMRRYAECPIMQSPGRACSTAAMHGAVRSA